MIFGKLLLAAATLGGANDFSRSLESSAGFSRPEYTYQERERLHRVDYESESRRLAAEIDRGSLLLGSWEHARSLEASPPVPVVAFPGYGGCMTTIVTGYPTIHAVDLMFDMMWGDR